MRITYDPSSGPRKSAGNINMSLDDVIKANETQNAGQGFRQGNNARAKWIQGGTAKNKPQFQRQNQQQRQQPQFQNRNQQQFQQRNNPMQQGFGGGPKPTATGQKTFGGLRPYLSGASGKLVISNLDPKVTEDDMNTLFAAFGEVKEAKIHCDRDGNSLGSAQIIFEQYGDAVRGMQRYNGVTLDGRPMHMHIEKIHGPRPNRAPNANAQAGIAAVNTGASAKPLKRLQKGPQQLTVNSKPTIIKLTKGPQQQASAQQQIANRKAATVTLTGNRGPQQQIRNNMQTANQGAGKMQIFTKKNQMIFTSTQKGNNQQIINIQTKKKPQQQQQVGGARWPPNMQMNMGVTKNFSFGVPAPGVGLLKGPTSLTGLARPGILNRLDGGSSQGLLGPAPIYQAAPATSVLDRLDGGPVVQNKPLMPNPPVLSRLGGTVGGTTSSGSILNRVGPKPVAAKPGTGKVIPVIHQHWSFAVPGGKPVTPKATGLQSKLAIQRQNKPVIQVQKKPAIQMQNKKVIQMQGRPVAQNLGQQPGQKRGSFQQQGQNKRIKQLPTAAQLDAELDDYLSKMNAKK